MNNALAAAKAFFGKGQIDEAKQACTTYLLRYPGDADALNLMGLIHHKQGDLLSAKKFIIQAATYADNPSPYLYNVGLISALQKDHDQALGWFTQAQNADGKNAMVLIDMAKDFHRRNWLEKAYETYRSALTLEPDNARAAAGLEAVMRDIEAIIGRLRGVVPPSLDGRKQVVFTLKMRSRIGHVIVEPFLLKNLFDPQEYEVVLLTPKIRDVNRAVFEIATRDARVVEVEDIGALRTWGVDIGMFAEGDRTYCLMNMQGMTRHLLARIEATGQYLPHRYRLLEEEEERGRALRRAFGIADNARIVTVYARESGFLPNLVHHKHRNMDIMNYIDAIKYLVESGYTVVRIGDTTQKRLPDLGDRVVDAPFHDRYDPLVDPYFIACSTFMINCYSGPMSLAQTFGVPSLLVNSEMAPIPIPTPGDLVAFKKYYSTKLKRYLSADEVSMLDAIEIYSAEHLTAKHIELQELNSSEMLRVTREMVQRIDGVYVETPEVNERFRALTKRLHDDRKSSGLTSQTNYFGLSCPWGTVSHEYCDFYSDFMR